MTEIDPIVDDGKQWCMMIKNVLIYKWYTNILDS